MRIILVAALLVWSSVARAETITVGLFAPTAPFPSTAARVELASRLGEHIAKALGGSGSGKVFARAGDFAVAVKTGELSVALVDAAYLATVSGNYTVIAAAVRGGAVTHGWQLVARGATKLGALEGKRVLVPGIGGRETDLVLNVLFGGEVSRDFFAKIEPAPDPVSALAALGLGKADAAVVPVGVELPAGAAVVLQLPALSGPVLVSYAGISVQRRQAIAAAVASFSGDATVSGFAGIEPDVVRQVARRFTVPVKRGPLVVPAIWLLVGDLIEGRTFPIERTPVTAFVAKPERR